MTLARSLILSLLVVASSSACSSEEDSRSGFEALRARSLHIIDGEEKYVVEWDLALTLDELRDYYDHYIDGDRDEEAGARSSVNRVNNQDDVWANGQQKNLTYCVSTNFGSGQARIINEMNQAANAWKLVGNVKFIYKASEDANCTSSNPNVIIAVQKWNTVGPVANSFFPSAGKGSLFLDLAAADVPSPNAPLVTSAGILRHELGHILGLRHEHIRNPLQPCDSEPATYAPLTPYDKNSVMHYPQCGGFPNSTMSISALDAAGVHELYGPMPARPQVVVIPTLCSQGTPLFSLSWFRIRGVAATSFEAEVKRGNVDWQPLNVNGTSTTYAGLSGRADALRVRACNDVGCGEYSEPAPFQRTCF